MTSKTQQMLDQIDAALAANDTSSQELWDILSALRGPDNYANYNRKETGTVYVRQAAFPKTAESGNFYRAQMKPFEGPLDLTYHTVDEDMHFEGHLQQAFTALGLRPKTEA